MKNLIITLSVLLLSSCALWDSYNMSKFDNNEYYLINSVHTNAVLGKEECGTPKAKYYVTQVWTKSNEFVNYASAIPNNEETITMSIALLQITKGLSDKYEETNSVNKIYCEAKFELIKKNSVTIQNVVGGKPR